MSSPLQNLVPAELSPLSLARMLWKQKRLVGLIWLVVTVLSLVWIRSLPPQYYAEAVILVDSQKVPERYVSTTVTSDVQDRINNITQQIMSSRQLGKIIADFQLYGYREGMTVRERHLELMRHDIHVEVDRGRANRGPGFFRIGFTSSNAATSAQVANRVANVFIEENLKTRETQAEGTSEFIEAQLAESKRRLDTLETAVSNYKRQHYGELPQQENSLAGTLGRLQVTLEANRDTLNRAQQNLLVLENTLSTLEASESAQAHATETAARTTSPAAPAVSGPVRKPPVERLLRPSDSLQAELDQLLTRYTDEHPEVRRLSAKLVRQRELEAKQPAAPVSGAPGNETEVYRPLPAGLSSAQQAELLRRRDELQRTRERIAGIQAQAATTKQEIETRRKEQERILAQIGEMQGRVDRLPIREQEMSQVSRDYEIQKLNYQSLLDKKLNAQMATALERRQKAERFTMAEPAAVPEKPVSPNRKLFAAIGLVLGLVLSLLVGFGLELRKGRFLGEWELPATVPVLGRMPLITLDASPAKPGLLSRLRPSLVVGSSALLGAAALLVYLIRG